MRKIKEEMTIREKIEDFKERAKLRTKEIFIVSVKRFVLFGVLYFLYEVAKYFGLF